MANRRTLDQANRRASERLKAGPVALAAHYDKRLKRVVIQLNTGIEIAFPPLHAQGLETARAADLDPIEITPSGLGLHFPKLDADLYLPALLEGFLGSKRWAAGRLGQDGGRAKSAAKAAAARSNGRLGGRPKKVAVAR